jgi:hypothetical protein
LVLISDVNNTKKTKLLLGFKNQRKKSAKTGRLGFLRNNCAYGGRESRKPTKNQREIQGGIKPSVWVGFLRQKKDNAYTFCSNTSVMLLSPSSSSTMAGLRAGLEKTRFFI